MVLSKTLLIARAREHAMLPTTWWSMSWSEKDRYITSIRTVILRTNRISPGLRASQIRDHRMGVTVTPKTLPKPRSKRITIPKVGPEERRVYVYRKRISHNELTRIRQPDGSIVLDLPKGVNTIHNLIFEVNPSVTSPFEYDVGVYFLEGEKFQSKPDKVLAAVEALLEKSISA